MGFDKEKVPLIDEMALTVRFGDQVVDLQKVKVVDNCQYDMIL